MAIDTRAKRASCVGVGRSWARSKHPELTKSGPWRAASGHTYAGFTIEVAVPTVLGVEYAEADNRLHFTNLNEKLHYSEPDNRVHYSSRGTD